MLAIPPDLHPHGFSIIYIYQCRFSREVYITNMRLSAVIPIVLGLGALVLSFLALFAGSRQGFMEDYAVVTVSKAI